MSPMLLHLVATLLRAFFPALQDAGFLRNVHKSQPLEIGVP